MTADTVDSPDPQPVSVPPVMDQLPTEPPPAKPFEAPTDQVPLPPNVCPNCLATSDKTIEYCESCGFYVRFGVVVGGPEEEEEEKPFPLSSVAAVAATFTVVALINISLLFYTPQGSPERTWWSVRQLALGFLGFAVAHMFCFLKQLHDDSDRDLLDFVLRPLSPWMESARMLPKRLWAFVMVTAGLTAMFGSIVVLRGIPYDALFTGEPVREHQAVVNAIVAEQAQHEEAATLEDALNNLVGDEGLAPEDPFEPDPERLYKDAVIIAYSTDSVGVVERVMVAGAIDNKLKQLGIVHEIPDGARRKLTRVLPETIRETPFLAEATVPETDDSEKEGESESNDAADSTNDAPQSDDESSTRSADDNAKPKTVGAIKWVRPQWLCRVSYIETGEGIPIELQFHWIVRKLQKKGKT